MKMLHVKIVPVLATLRQRELLSSLIVYPVLLAKHLINKETWPPRIVSFALETGTMTVRLKSSAQSAVLASINQTKVPRRVKNVMPECTFHDLIRLALACALFVILACSVRHQDQLALTVAWVSTGRQTSKHAHHVQQESGATRPN